MTTEFKNITLIGAGNLATNLGKALCKKGMRISEVYSRTEESAAALASILETGFTTELSQLKSHDGLYIVSLTDSAATEMVSQITRGKENAVFVHTSGSVPMSVWEGYAVHYGVLYPMQTFSKQREVSFNDIPVFVEAADGEILALLKQLAGRLSEKVYEATSEQRRYLHLGAVVACNFTNHMYALCAKILAEQHIPFEVMYPLIDETTRKIHYLSPEKAQTGPAIRSDRGVIDKHLELLESYPEIRELYEKISKSIYNL